MMMKITGTILLALIVSALFSCATEKKTGKGNLDFQALVGADDSTYLPFVIESSRIEEVRNLFFKDNLPMRPYKTDFSEKLKIPAHVKYKELPASVNEKIVAGFFNALRPPVKITNVQGNTVIICGPHLTALLKKSDVLTIDDYTRIVGPFHYFKRQDVLIEWAVKGGGIPKILTLLRNLLFVGDSITVRKLNAFELDWYWVSNSYDIDEPLFVFENGRHQVMIHFTAEGKIFLIELFDTLTWRYRDK